MKQAIIIPTHIHFNQWLQNLIPTIKTTYDVIIVTNTDVNNQYEMAAINKGLELGYDEFFVLQDTTEINDNNLWPLIFEQYKGRSVFINPKGQMFLNKYLRTTLLGINAINTLPVVHDKRTAVDAETNLHQQYMKIENVIILDENFIDNDMREQKFGRTNMVLQNNYVKKYKACWSPGMII